MGNSEVLVHTLNRHSRQVQPSSQNQRDELNGATKLYRRNEGVAIQNRSSEIVISEREYWQPNTGFQHHSWGIVGSFEYGP